MMISALRLLYSLHVTITLVICSKTKIVDEYESSYEESDNAILNKLITSAHPYKITNEKNESLRENIKFSEPEVQDSPIIKALFFRAREDNKNALIIDVETQRILSVGRSNELKLSYSPDLRIEEAIKERMQRKNYSFTELGDKYLFQVKGDDLNNIRLMHNGECLMKDSNEMGVFAECDVSRSQNLKLKIGKKSAMEEDDDDEEEDSEESEEYGGRSNDSNGNDKKKSKKGGVFRSIKKLRDKLLSKTKIKKMVKAVKNKLMEKENTKPRRSSKIKKKTISAKERSDQPKQDAASPNPQYNLINPNMGQSHNLNSNIPNDNNANYSNPQNNYNSNPQNNYNPNPQNNYNPNSPNNYNTNPQNNYNPNPQNNYNPNSQNNYNPNSQNNYSPNSPNNYNSNPQNSYNQNPQNNSPNKNTGQFQESFRSGPWNSNSQNISGENARDQPQRQNANGQQGTANNPPVSTPKNVKKEGSQNEDTGDNNEESTKKAEGKSEKELMDKTANLLTSLTNLVHAAKESPKGGGSKGSSASALGDLAAATPQGQALGMAKNLFA